MDKKWIERIPCQLQLLALSLVGLGRTAELIRRALCGISSLFQIRHTGAGPRQRRRPTPKPSRHRFVWLLASLWLILVLILYVCSS